MKAEPGRASTSDDRLRRPGRRWAGLAGAVLVALATFAWAAGPAPAGQTHVLLGSFCAPTGIGVSPCAPSFSKAYSVSVHQSDGDVIVLDSSAEAILRFKANGEPEPFSALGTNAIDGKGPGADETPQNGFTFSGGFLNEQQVAVDDSGGATDGNIYVTQGTTPGLQVIDIFAPTGAYLGQLTGVGSTPFDSEDRLRGVAVDPDGNVFVANTREDMIYRCAPAANPPVNADCALYSSSVNAPGQLATGAGSSAGALFVVETFAKAFKLGTGGEVLYQLKGGENSGVAVNPANGHVFVMSNGGALSEYDASGSTEATLISNFGSSNNAVAVDQASGRVYLAKNAQTQIEVWSPLVPLPAPTVAPATNVGETSATANGAVNTFGEQLTECKFEYGPTTAYGNTKPCFETPVEIGTGSKAVHAELTGLAPETAYHYRLLAKNSRGTELSKDQAFQTVSRPELLGEWSEGVLFDEARLKAQINPQSADTSYRFEWGLAGVPYEHASASTSIGAEPTAHTVGLFLAGLTPGTAYHFRIVAENHCHPESAPPAVCTSESKDHPFTTYAHLGAEAGCANDALRSGAGALLPDCRAYEMVSPVEKNGGDIVNEVNGGGVHVAYIQSAADGERITYSAAPAFGDQPSALYSNQYLASRSEEAPHEGGWVNAGINAPLGKQLLDFNYTENQVAAFSADLCSYWFRDHNAIPPAAGGQEGFRNLYRRQNCAPGEGGLEALSTVAPPAGKSYVPSGAVQGFSADLGSVFFVAFAALTEDAAATERVQIYLHRAGEASPRLVSILPNGLAHSPAGTSNDEVGGGGEDGGKGNLENAVSGDGRRVFWSASISNNGQGDLYMRENPGAAETAAKDGEGDCVPDPLLACTIAVSGGGGSATFWDATPSGSAALYSEGNLGAGKATLYRFDVASRTRSVLAEGLYGLPGASEDLSRIYLVSSENLAPGQKNGVGEEATGGQPNLYLYEGGTFTFIGTLLGGDVENNGVYNAAYYKPFFRATRVSADGAHLAFESRAPLSGYDNLDAKNGEADVEVFLYEAEAGGALHCVSCNPSGARPRGGELPSPYHYPASRQHGALPTDIQAAAWIPTWEHPLHASNVLAEDGGRLFFNSHDALLPRDTNAAQDVYEWEAAGEGGCEVADADYFAKNGGCLYLITTGESPQESELWEAGADGGDVFFTTAASLLPQDPGLIDLYDARVEGGFAQPEEKAICEGEACQSPPGAPGTTTPASSAYHGPGNVKGAKKRRCPKGKRKVRRHGKTRCVKKRHHRKKHHGRHGRRADHDRRAAR